MATRSKKDSIESVRSKLREAAKQSGMTQQEIGEAMGFSPLGARQAVSRILKEGSAYDPRLSTLLAFCHAIKRSLSDLL
jgi:transcriptional regulator with XRE-family HTH domain